MPANAGRSPLAVAPRGGDSALPTGAEAVLLVVAAASLLVGVALRFVLARTPLWLDEAQTVAIAGLPLSDIPAALRQDGHPPLYYVVLHAWMQVAGNGDAAVRALSALFGTASLAPLAALARRLGGSSTVLAAVALAATSPFLVRYATEARMYALVVLLALTWWLAVQRALEDPRPARVAAVTALVGGLVLTHYWSLFLLAAAGLELLRRVRRGGTRAGPARHVLVAHVAGGLLLVPWLPSLLVQLRRTGTPWADGPNPVSAAVQALADFAGGPHRGSSLTLFALLLVLLLVGTLGRPLGRRRLELDLSVVPAARPLALLVGVTAAIALGVVWVTDTAFATRYAAVIAGFVLLLAARGAAQFDRLLQPAVVGVAAVLGIAGSWYAVDRDRSQGAEVAEAIADDVSEGDVVVACPDQLGPAVSRYLPDDVVVLGYPTLAGAARIDWTDYAERNAEAAPYQVAGRIAAASSGGDVWLVWNSGYRTFEGQCEQLRRDLVRRLGDPVEVVSRRDGVYEPMRLTRFRGEGG